MIVLLFNMVAQFCNNGVMILRLIWMKFDTEADIGQKRMSFKCIQHFSDLAARPAKMGIDGYRCFFFHSSNATNTNMTPLTILRCSCPHQTSSNIIISTLTLFFSGTAIAAINVNF